MYTNANKYDAIYCNATCDGYLCWPPTPAGETLFQNCPKALLSNEKMCAFRRCGAEGLWLGRHFNDTSPKGWTNYTPCFPTLVQKILDKVNEDEAEAQLKFETAVNTRTIEMVGIVSSFLTICASIIIFNAFPSLHNRRTVIHRNLFYALLMEVTVRMILYTQQSYSFDGVDPIEEDARKGIEYFPYICEGAYVLLEYSRLVVYGWMFIEGIFLNTLISANTLRNEIPINYFYIGGWGVPAIVIAIWATVVGRHYSEEPLNTCWYGYNYLPSYYIIQGPILAIVLLNMLFLGTIMSVIIMKLRRTNDSELRKIQKTIRATLILLPLLGIINIFNLFDYPLDGSSTGFAIWAYFTHFFRSFQGVFISFIYCFSNGEVRKAIRKKFERRTWFRFDWLQRHRAALANINARERPVFVIADNQNLELVPMPPRTWTRPSSTHMVSEIEPGPSQVEAMAQSDTPTVKQKPKKKSVSTLDIDFSFSTPAPVPHDYEYVRHERDSSFSQTMPTTFRSSQSSINIRTTTPDTEVRRVSVHMDDLLPHISSIQLNISTQSFEDSELAPQKEDPRPHVTKPDMADASTSASLGEHEEATPMKSAAFGGQEGDPHIKFPHFTRSYGADTTPLAPPEPTEFVESESGEKTMPVSEEGAASSYQSYRSRRRSGEVDSKRYRRSSAEATLFETRENETRRSSAETTLFETRENEPRRSSAAATLFETRENETRRRSGELDTKTYRRSSAETTLFKTRENETRRRSGELDTKTNRRSSAKTTLFETRENEPRRSSAEATLFETRENETRRSSAEATLFETRENETRRRSGELDTKTNRRSSAETTLFETRENETRRASHEARPKIKNFEYEMPSTSQSHGDILYPTRINPQCLVHNPRRRRTPSFEDIPPFNYPPATFKKKPIKADKCWFTNCFFPKNTKRASSLEGKKTKSQEDGRRNDSPTRSSSGCVPHTIPRRAYRAPFVRPGLVTRDNCPSGIRSISSCF